MRILKRKKVKLNFVLAALTSCFCMMLATPFIGEQFGFANSFSNIYLDGEYIPLEFDTKGAVIRFVMPEHDVKLECRARGSMQALQRECPSCHALTPQASSTCLSCGFEIEKYVVCPECGAEVTEKAKFCHECGRNLRDKE